jgi:4-oxalocrotonate tautomerase
LRRALNNRSNSNDKLKKVMPLINVKILEGVFTPRQKQEMITKLTDAMVSIEGENMRPVTLVIIEELKSGDWGVGGKGFTTGDVKALAAGKPMADGQSNRAKSHQALTTETH